MKKSQRMMMVPEWMGQLIKTKFRNEIDPYSQGLAEIDTEIENVLKEKKTPSDKKSVLTEQLLRRYENILKQKRKKKSKKKEKTNVKIIKIINSPKKIVSPPQKKIKKTTRWEHY